VIFKTKLVKKTMRKRILSKGIIPDERKSETVMEGKENNKWTTIRTQR
jgi:hypothetical protein